MARLMTLLPIATINKYCYNNKINKTNTIDKWLLSYK